MNSEILSWLLSHYGQEQFRPGLERIIKALGPLRETRQKNKIITIAGTNGKGETALHLAEFLKEKTYCLWTSPHISRITERFRSQDGEISSEELWGLITQCHGEVKSRDLNLSFYEFLFFVFCTWAQKVSPEFLILEVGLGGRFDAVNSFDADVVLLPSISRDHQEFLGNRYDLILEEKLAVLREGKTLISYLELNYLRERVLSHVTSKKARLVDLEGLKIAHGFEFSKRNLLLARAAELILREKTLSSTNLLSAWSTEHMGFENRGEVITHRGEWILFGSHNTDGLRKLIQLLHSGNYTFARPPYDGVIVAFSRRDQRDLSAMLKMLKTSDLGKVIVTTFSHPKAAAKELIEPLCRQEGLEFVANIEDYIQKVSGQKFLVSGSYYFLGSFRDSLRGR